MYVRIGHPVGRRYSIGYPLFGVHGGLGAHTLQRLAQIANIVDDLAGQVVRRAHIVLLTGPNVFEFGAHHRLGFWIAVPVLTRAIDDTVMRTLKHVTRISVFDNPDERVVRSGSCFGQYYHLFAGFVAQFAYINSVIVLMIVVAFVTAAMKYTVLQMVN